MYITLPPENPYLTFKRGLLMIFAPHTLPSGEKVFRIGIGASFSDEMRGRSWCGNALFERHIMPHEVTFSSLIFPDLFKAAWFGFLEPIKEKWALEVADKPDVHIADYCNDLADLFNTIGKHTEHGDFPLSCLPYTMGEGSFCLSLEEARSNILFSHDGDEVYNSLVRRFHIQKRPWPKNNEPYLSDSILWNPGSIYSRHPSLVFRKEENPFESKMRLFELTASKFVNDLLNFVSPHVPTETV